jgi:hypothetical protein
LWRGEVGLHLDLDTQDTLSEENVSDGVVDEVDSGLTRVDHETVGEFHGFGTGSTEFTGYDDLATLGAGFHDESKDTVACTEVSIDWGVFGGGGWIWNMCKYGKRELHDKSQHHSPPHGKTTEELVPQRLGLSNGGKTSELDLLGVELKTALGELESLLDESLELTDTSTLVTKNLLGMGGSDDDLGSSVGHSDLTTGVALLGELSGAVGESESGSLCSGGDEIRGIRDSWD